MDALTIITMFGTACAELSQQGISIEEIALLAGDIPAAVVEQAIESAERANMEDVMYDMAKHGEEF